MNSLAESRRALAELQDYLFSSGLTDEEGYALADYFTQHTTKRDEVQLSGEFGEGIGYAERECDAATDGRGLPAGAVALAGNAALSRAGGPDNRGGNQ